MMDGVVALFGTPALARLADLQAMAEEWRPDVVVHEVLEAAGSLARHEARGPRDRPRHRADVPASMPSSSALRVPRSASPNCGSRPRPSERWTSAHPSLQPDDGPPPWPNATPLRPSAGEPGPVAGRVADVLAADEPLAYFTLGTVKNTETADFKVGLTALEAYDGVVIATTGRRLDPEELGSLPPNVIIEEFVPQDAVLERVDLLVSHSGSGTMLGGLVHGVPQVALPRGTDQPQNAALLERSGAGVVVQPDDYAVDTIDAAIRTVTGDPSFRAAAERVRDEIAAMPDADAVWAGIPV